MKTLPVFLTALGALFFAGQSDSFAGTTINAGTISEVTGPGSLDLTGNILYAVDFHNELPSQTVNGVSFVHDATPPPGFSSIGPQLVTNWETKPDFGATADDDALEEIYSDIRWTNQSVNGGPDAPLQANMAVTAGLQYRLQVLFSGNHDEYRGWDIRVDGVDAVDNITSNGVNTGAGPPAWALNRALVYTYDFTAADNEVNVYFGQLFGLGVEATDPNAIWQGITLEQLPPAADSDGDGLPDTWEMLYFTNLAQTGSGDPDADGLTNTLELGSGTIPNDPDSDDDGLNDGPEVNTHLTDPRKADTDGDGLSDGQEVVTYGSNPLSLDSDSDGYRDGTEVAYATNPADPASYPLISAFASSFTGGDAGDGLDLNGTFIAAARFCPSFVTGSWPVRNATFVPYYDVPGLTQDAVNEIEVWTTMSFPGTLTPDDVNLAEVVKSIRYQGTIFNISLAGLTAGRVYKLQLLFAENCCNNRGFDVYVDNRLVADEFSPPALQGGANAAPTRGAAITYGFVAAGATVSIRLDKTTVTTPTLNDINPILNALSLEELTLPDTDGDSLPDAWEIQFFNNLSGSGTSDPDSDGRTNAVELATGTAPNDADTDNDGLNDGGEAAGTNPFAADTDGDTLTDGEEVNTAHTNPLLADTDGDGFQDGVEVLAGSNPVLNTSVPAGLTTGLFTGGDAGEGLDLDGTFVYAFNFGTPGLAGQARDANFTADSAPGITFSAVNQIPNWHAPVYGDTANDDVVEMVMQSIRWTPAPGTLGVNLAGLEAGKRYKLQLLFAETGTARGFDIVLEGATFVDDFFPGNLQGNSTTQAAVVTAEFVARDTVLNIVLNGNTTTAADKNPILSGATLEALTPAAFEITGVTRTATSLTINARGTPGHTYSVDFSSNLTVWEEVWDSLVPNAAGNASFEDTNLTRVNGRRGYYRVRDP